MLSMSYMPASLSDFDSDFIAFCCHFNVRTSISACSFHRIDWIEYQISMLCDGFFQFSVSDSYQRISFFTLNPSRIALIITIRIWRYNRFSLFLSLFRQFSTPISLPQSARIPVQPPACCSKPIITASWRERQKEAHRYISTSRHRCFNSYRSCFSASLIPTIDKL